MKIRHLTMNPKTSSTQTSASKSMARIINPKVVEVIAPDGEAFRLFCPVGQYIDEDTRNNTLHCIEEIFNHSYSKDKEKMIQAVLSAAVLYALDIRGINSGDRQEERTRIGARIKQLREERSLEARDLAAFAGIDAANLSRIENGRYSVGLDILSKIAAALRKKIDFVDI